MTSSHRAFSYIRFSTPAQKLGDSLRRQLERTAAYCAEHGLILDESLTDQGLSGYHGTHRKRGALGRFLARVKVGEIPRGSVLIVEAFDRMSRQTPREAQEQFLSLINAGIEIVTLIDGQRFSAQSVDANAGQLFMSIGMMMGAHAESANKADRVRESWKKRRGSLTINVPGWIIKTENGMELDSVKAEIIRRIFRDVLTMGIEKLVKKLNTEGTPILSLRKQQSAWAPMGQLIRGRQVLGFQEICHFANNKKQRTGEFIKSYPAVVTEDEWHAANAALDSRRHGVGNGRNVTRMANLFGDLARCGVCGGRMKIRQKGKAKTYAYLGCSNVGIGKCEAKAYHRLNEVETEVLAIFGSLAYADKLQNDPSDSLLAQVAAARTDAAKLAQRYETVFEQFGDNADPLALANLDRISEQHKAAVANITKLERQLAATKIATPISDQLDVVRRFLAGLDGLQGEERVAARARIAAALPQFVRRLVFKQDGWSAELIDGWMFQNGSGWRASGISSQGVTLWRPGYNYRRDGLPHTIRLRVPERITEAVGKRSLTAYKKFEATEAARKHTNTSDGG